MAKESVFGDATGLKHHRATERLKVAVWTALSLSDRYVTGVGKHIVHMVSGLAGEPGFDVRLLLPAGSGSAHTSAGNLSSLPQTNLGLKRSAITLLAATIGWPTVRHWSPDCDWLYCPREHWIAPGRARLAVTVHDLWSLDQENPSWRERTKVHWMLGRALRRADLVLAASSFTAERLNVHFGPLDHKTRTVGNGASPVFFAQPSGDVALIDSRLADHPYGITVGGLTLKKGGDRFLALAQLLFKRRPYLKFVVVGPVDKRFGPETWPGNVLHIGRGLTDEQLALLVASAEFSCSLSRYEGFGITLAEAMAVGTPVVASDISAHREVAGGAGVLVDPADTGGAGVAIERLLDDPAHRQDLQRRGRERAQDHTWAKSVTRLKQALIEFSPR